jgi:signal transduction histidine kinase
VPRFSSNGAFCGYIGSCIDITERKQAEMSSLELSGHLLRAQEEERARIARELHDDISQRMAFLQIGLEQFENIPKLSANNRKELHDLARVASDLSSDLHSLSHQLHPTRLELQGLVAAMGSLCREISDQHRLQIKFVSHQVPGEIPRAVGLCLYRIAQEALRNVAKHGDTLDAKVELSISDQGIDLCISDSGTGFNPQSVHLKGGLGLLSMRERVRLIEGQLSIESRPLRGTQVRVHVPLSANTTHRGSDRSQLN